MKSWRFWAVVALGWSVLAALAASQHLAFLAYADRPHQIGQVFARTMVDWYTCAVFTPAIFYVAARVANSSLGAPRAVLVHLLAGTVFIAAKLGLYLPIATRMAWVEPGQNFGTWLLSDGFALVLVYAGIVGVFYLLRYSRLARERAVHAAALEARLSNVRLDAVRARLHPHFLFNALNALTALIPRSPERAERLVMQLSELLRQVLDTEPAEQSTLNDELAFVRRYLDIMQVRIGDRLRLTEDIEPQTGAARVPSLVLQPLVENALVHGISKSTRAGEVQIRARRSAEMLVIEVLDDGPGPSNAPARQGVGLTNTRLLLEQLYGRRHALTLEARAEGGTATRLVIPFTVVP